MALCPGGHHRSRRRRRLRPPPPKGRGPAAAAARVSESLGARSRRLAGPQASAAAAAASLASSGAAAGFDCATRTPPGSRCTSARPSARDVRKTRVPSGTAWKSGERRGTVPKRQRLRKIFCRKGEGMGAATHDTGEELRLTPSAQRVLGVVVQSRRERETRIAPSPGSHFVCPCCAAVVRQLSPLDCGFL